MGHSHHHRHRRKQFFWIGIAVGALAVIAIASPLTLSIIADVRGSEKASQKTPPPDWSSYFASTTILAKAAYVVDLGTGQTLFSKNASEPLPLASLTKLMTAATALASAPTTTIVAVTRSAIVGGAGDSGLYVDERWRLGDLLRFTLVVSSNSGAIAVAQNIGALAQNPVEVAAESHLGKSTVVPSVAAPNAAILVSGASTVALASDEAAFVQEMNTLAGTLGLTSASFFNPSGLDLNTITAGAYASAEDVSKLLIHLAIHYPDVIGATSFPTITVSSLNDILHSGKNTDVLSLAGLNLVASKTGYTDLAGGNLGIIANIDGHPVVIVVLGSTHDDRFNDVAALAVISAKIVAIEK